MVKHLAGREGVRICPAVPLSCTRTYAALVAQRIEQEPSKLLVAGSSPAGGTGFFSSSTHTAAVARAAGTFASRAKAESRHAAARAGSGSALRTICKPWTSVISNWAP